MIQIQTTSGPLPPKLKINYFFSYFLWIFQIINEFYFTQMCCYFFLFLAFYFSSLYNILIGPRGMRYMKMWFVLIFLSLLVCIFNHYKPNSINFAMILHIWTFSTWKQIMLSPINWTLPLPFSNFRFRQWWTFHPLGLMPSTNGTLFEHWTFVLWDLWFCPMVYCLSIEHLSFGTCGFR